MVYKDHRLTEIEIAPALYQGSSQNGLPLQEADAIKMAPALYGTVLEKTQGRTQEAGAISTVSLGVLRGNVKPSNLEDGHLQQRRRGQIQIGPNGEGAGRRDLLQELKGQLGRESSLSRDGLALLNLPNSGQKLHHIAYSGAPFHSQDSTARNAAVFSLFELMKNAVLVESGPNRKKNKKPGVRI